MTRRFLLVLSLLLASASAFQQEPQPQKERDPDQGFRIGVRVNQVFLSVNALSSGGGGFVQGLTRDDFRVFEDGVEQEIVNFASGETPVHVALLIDASGSTRFSQSSIQGAAYRFAESLSEEDRVAIVTFSYEAKLTLDWTNDLGRVDERLKSIWAKGKTVLNDALYVTYDDLFRDLPGKKAIIVLSDGVDFGSLVSPQHVLDLAERSETLVYAVSLLDEYRHNAVAMRHEYEARLMKVPLQLQDDYILQSKAFLGRLCSNTGGRVFDVSETVYLKEIYERVAEELKSQYYLSYVPSNDRKAGQWRSVEVESTNRADITLRTRPGYYEDKAEVTPDGR